ncbi:MAG: DNA polymerase III subunit epsilon [Gammaproteobacteria bacterium]|nr:DNA polymerase III subunit epsilon [Gammaproteobacteria bacterium]MDH3447882.1 DNA polymerase III subunit epsilon [Gammaproteobacteria bacterium]
MRQIVLDTETTGLEVSLGHRIIEIGCIELVNRRVTGNHWHYYVNPGREIDAGAFEVHGISSDFLQDKHRFAELAQDFIDYVAGAELIIHNAPFDIGFLDYELSLLEPPAAPLQQCCNVLDTLLMARQKHPGQKNNLDALCKRYDIDNSHRSLHGALLDARILADVYLAMTGGQTSLGLDAGQGEESGRRSIEPQRIDPGQPLPLWQVDAASRQADGEYIEFLATQHEDPVWK